MTRAVVGAALLLAALVSVFVPATANAAQDGEAITATIRYEDPDTGEKIPAAGVSITVSTSDGDVVGTGVTDADGVFLLPLPGPGVYLVELDSNTLPEGIRLKNPDRNPATVGVEEGQVGRTIFSTQVGDVVADDGSGISFRQVAQLTLEGIKLGLFLGMGAIGLSLIFGTTGLVNFAHGELIGWGMLVAYFFNVMGFAGLFGFMSGWPAPFGGGVNLIFATFFAVAGGVLLGWAFDKIIFAPLRRRGSSLISQMVVTIGISLLLRYIYLFAFRGAPRFFADYTAQRDISWVPVVDITPKDAITVLLSVIVLVGVGLFLVRARMGKAMRAVADNKDLAESSGIDVQRVIRFVWMLGGGLAGLGGVFIGLSEQVSWNIGFRILLLLFASVVLGGLGTAYGALVGALIVGVGIQVSTLFIPTELKNVGALVVLILVLVVRPEGILGKRERVG
ncbi:MAG: branched-chain amino acid ABC transporter permease [Proteobacteria bacterium]|nr:branched-chain amino acid ABC transporter permease [Pseudomonadota bacterium]